MFLKAISVVSVFIITGYQSFAVPRWKTSVAMGVFTKISNAYGSGKKAPEFILESGKRNLIMYYPGSPAKIVMDEYAYDICSGFGKDSLNALATLIGHELAHHYENHNWCSSFAFTMGDKSEIGKTLGKIDAQKKLAIETEADYFGSFFGYTAGFNTLEVTGDLLDKLYTAYNLPEKLKGYPTKTERKEIATKRLEELEPWILLFDLATGLYVLGEYELASYCFGKLVAEFPSREMYNNTGASYLYWALGTKNAKELPFRLPIALDSGSRLKSKLSRGQSGTVYGKEWFDKTIDKALIHFKEANKRDPSYVPSYINLACAYLLDSNAPLALGIVTDIERNLSVTKNEFSALQTIKGIATYNMGDRDGARPYFEAAKQNNQNETTSYNLTAYTKLNGDLLDGFMDFVFSYFKDEELPRESLSVKEKISGISASEISYTKLNDKVILREQPSLNFYYQTNEMGIAMGIVGKNVNKGFLFPSYSQVKTSQMISKGDFVEQVKKKYGEPTKVVEEISGTFLVFDLSKVVFLLDEKKRVKNWFIYN